MNCANCNERLLARYRYCPSCSQKARLERLTITEVGHQAFHYFTHADKSVIGLVRNLATRSGTVAREYILGMRKKHFSPLNFFLMAAALNVLILNFDNSPVKVVLQESTVITQDFTAEQLRDAGPIIQRMVVAARFMQEHANLLAIATVPLTAYIFFLFFKRRDFNYTEHLVSCLYMAGFTTFFYTLMLVLNMVLRLDFGMVAALYFPLQLAYYCWFYYRLMRPTSVGYSFLAALGGAMIPHAISALLCILYAAGIIG